MAYAQIAPLRLGKELKKKRVLVNDMGYILANRGNALRLLR